MSSDPRRFKAFAGRRDGGASLSVRRAASSQDVHQSCQRGGFGWPQNASIISRNSFHSTPPDPFESASETMPSASAAVIFTSRPRRFSRSVAASTEPFLAASSSP